MKMVERLFFHRIDAKAGGPAVGRQHHPSLVALAHEAKTALAFVQPAVARAQIALHAPIGQRVPPFSRMAGR
jgi:hypothetical protein